MAVGSKNEESAVRAIYQNLQPANFSTGIIEAVARQANSPLLVLPVRGVEWSDWGSEGRIAWTLARSPNRVFQARLLAAS